MSKAKFERGDKVRCIKPRGSLVLGTNYTVRDCDRGFISVMGNISTYAGDRFEHVENHTRYDVEKALEVFEHFGIRAIRTGATPTLDYFQGDGFGCRLTSDELLDQIFPPVPTELEKLEEQALKLAEDILLLKEKS